MKHSLLATSFLLAGTLAFGQAPATEHKAKTEGTKARTEAKMEEKKTGADVTYGRIKEFTAGQKIEIDIDNAPDKTFDLTDKNVTVKIAKGLKAGDPVKVAERSKMGKTTSVMITKHTGGGVAHGDKDPKAKKP